MVLIIQIIAFAVEACTSFIVGEVLLTVSLGGFSYLGTLTLSQDPGMDIGVTCLVLAAGYHAAATREQLIQAIGLPVQKACLLPVWKCLSKKRQETLA